MKKLSSILMCTSLLISCASQSENPKEKITQATIAPIETEEESAENKIMLGQWQGEMKDKKLEIVIEKITGDSVFGYSSLDGKQRPIKGIFSTADYDIPCSKAFEAMLSEPGDDHWDGIFTIKFVGFEDEKETENGPECIGNLKGREAMGEWNAYKGDHKSNLHLNKVK